MPGGDSLGGGLKSEIYQNPEKGLRLDGDHSLGGGP